MGQKICCGGFELGEGLELNGKTLKATGGSSGSGMIVNINNVTGFDKTFEEIRTAFMAGINVIFIDGNVVFHMCELTSNHLYCCGISDMTIDAESTMLEDITIVKYTLNDDDTFEYEQGYASFS